MFGLCDRNSDLAKILRETTEETGTSIIVIEVIMGQICAQRDGPLGLQREREFN